MKYLLLFAIKIYWLTPETKRKKCIFCESCSKYVYRITCEFGFLKGLKILKKRMQQCKPGFYRLNEYEYRMADKNIIKVEDLIFLKRQVNELVLK